MVHDRDLLRFVLTALVVSAGAVAGVGAATDHPGLLPTVSESAADPADLHRVVTATERTLGGAHEQLQSLTAPLEPFFEHPTELILVFELGLLVEHLRLLNRVDESLAERLEQASTDRDEDPSDRDR